MMNITKLSIRNTFYKPTQVVLTILMLSVSIGLVLGIQEVDASLKKQFEGSLNGVDLVVGAKGSPLQLVLASVLHIDNPTGNIPLDEAEKIAKNPLVKKAVPISYGDNYNGYRIVGTDANFIALYKGELKEGTLQQNVFDVVLGAEVARKTKLKLGDTFKSTHGLTTVEAHEHHQLMKVVGILKSTHTVLDKLLVTPLASVWEIHEHHHHKEEHEHEEIHEHQEIHEHEDYEHQDHEHEKEITSLLLQFKNPTALLTMPRRINSNTNMQAALPRLELEKLNTYTGMGVQIITWIAYIVLAISSIIFFVNLYKMIKDRSFDLALLRTYGASTLQLSKMVVLEGSCILLISVVIGYGLSQCAMYFMSELLNENFIEGMVLQVPYTQYAVIFLFLVAILVLAVTMAILPLLSMNISKIISHEAK